MLEDVHIDDLAELVSNLEKASGAREVEALQELRSRVNILARLFADRQVDDLDNSLRT